MVVEMNKNINWVVRYLYNLSKCVEVGFIDKDETIFFLIIVRDIIIYFVW